MVKCMAGVISIHGQGSVKNMLKKLVLKGAEKVEIRRKYKNILTLFRCPHRTKTFIFHGLWGVSALSNIRSKLNIIFICVVENNKF